MATKSRTHLLEPVDSFAMQHVSSAASYTTPANAASNTRFHFSNPSSNEASRPILPESDSDSSAAEHLKSVKHRGGCVSNILALASRNLSSKKKKSASKLVSSWRNNQIIYIRTAFLKKNKIISFFLKER